MASSDEGIDEHLLLRRDGPAHLRGFVPIPVVRATGGLKDTVVPYNKATRTGNGFLFSNYNAHEMMSTIKKALTLFRDFNSWKILIQNAMQSDYSWARSAKEYKALYERLIG